jgi:signal transduction histidine kinase
LCGIEREIEKTEDRRQKTEDRRQKTRSLKIFKEQNNIKVNSELQNIKNSIEQSESITKAEKELLLISITAVDRDLTIVEFKLDRTEKVKRTTAILLEETIEELEQKRKAVEEINAALKISMEELKATQAQLIQSEKMASLGELTAGIAHEIQNPLNFVNNFAEVSIEMIEEMKQESAVGGQRSAVSGQQSAIELLDDIRQNLDKILHHGKRADAIVKGMLLHSRISSGQKELTDINALADEYLRLAYHGLRAKDKSFNADFKTNFDENLPKINIIPQDIGRVLLNLINNAFYAVSNRNLSASSDLTGSDNTMASEAYKPTVTVSTKLTLSLQGENLSRSIGSRGEVLIIVQDNGPGIPDEIKDKIFQPFFTTKPTGSGTGLGLSLSYDIVKAHGGGLRVESKEGEGSEFIIQLLI